MDNNLQKIKEVNMHRITHGSVKEAIDEAKDYLRYMTRYDHRQFETEFNEFVKDVKEIRKKSRTN